MEEQFMPEEESVLRQKNFPQLNSREKLVICFLNGETTERKVLDYIAGIAGTHQQK